MRPPAKLKTSHRRLVAILRKAFKKDVSRSSPSRDISDAPELPFLPPELWDRIIQQACLSLHDPLDTSQELSFLDSTRDQPATYRATMSIKTSLSLVSSKWRDLTRKYLYEFVWISHAAQAKSLAHTLLLEYCNASIPSGKYIRRLHIETQALERCVPADLRTILDYSPNLCIYSDHHSVQRSLIEPLNDPKCSPEAILSLVTHPRIRRLSWTSYDDVPFDVRMSPFLKNPATRLEYLELSSCSPNLRAIYAQSLADSSNRAIAQMDVHLPSLRALKVSLDNETFAVLASWTMPELTNLSVVSADFSYTGSGFSRFFQAHGAKLRQLELGHSSSLVEEHYLTTPHHLLLMQQHQQRHPVPLAEWCPNLREFICSADAGWHWRSPDWIAPHILLPAHPTVELIGIRDIDLRLRDDTDLPNAYTPYFSLYEQMSSLLRRDAFPSLRFVRDLSPVSHRMRSVRPDSRITQFWTRVVERCQERGLWFEDCNGINLTLRGLQRACLPQA
ncbi:hypothetical protein CERSUDRAFT_89514 [Gelatoporia subvermispora B]|uniref:F-box domain-containing protein n=1 Tax=Ceriporiopsis subvermispora (strain B) TaxID=914234 RepID=M2QYM6_CERS8|nr:hypothetical protein CERSUDRAFT_89514 [Gelatoporia subvermispora B]